MEENRKRGKCNKICINFKALKPSSGEGRYESGQVRCQTCAIFLHESGLESNPNNFEGGLLYCKCCGIRARKKPRGKKSKELLNRKFLTSTKIKVDPSEIPQANDLFKIVNFLKLIKMNSISKSEFISGLEINERQVDYYKKTVEILGLVEYQNKSKTFENIVLSTIGSKLLSMDWPTKFNILIQQIKKINFYSSLFTQLEQNGSLEKKFLLNYFTNENSLSTEAAKKRLSTFVKWLDTLDLIINTKNDLIWKETYVEGQTQMSPKILEDKKLELPKEILNKNQINLIKKISHIVINNPNFEEKKMTKLMIDNQLPSQHYITNWKSLQNFWNLSTAENPPTPISLIIEFERIHREFDIIPDVTFLYTYSRFGLDRYTDEFGGWENFYQLLDYSREQSKEHLNIQQHEKMIEKTNPDISSKISSSIELSRLRNILLDGVESNSEIITLFEKMEEVISRLKRHRIRDISKKI